MVSRAEDKVTRALLTQLATARDAVGVKEHDVLRRTGWKHTSSTPGCFWMWERALPDGRVFLVDTATALRIQRYWPETNDFGLTFIQWQDAAKVSIGAARHPDQRAVSAGSKEHRAIHDAWANSTDPKQYRRTRAKAKR